MKTLLKLPKETAYQYLAVLYPSFFSTSQGKPVRIQSRAVPGYALINTSSAIVLSGHKRADIFRGLGELLLNQESSKSFTISAQPSFTFRGLMIDCSRNGVIKTDYLKKVIPALALLGLNYLTLYTEDTYEITGHPLIGYKRGKYTKRELKDLAKFAANFGITMFPCIQTLGHLEQVLKFPQYRHLQDDYNILSFKKKESYRLIEAMITSAIEPYNTDLIHIGLDETWGLGKGKCFESNKKIDPRQIYLDHVQKVNAICRKHKLAPIMWGDIVIGMHDTTFSMDKKQTGRLPKNIIMDFWNYYEPNQNYYKNKIKEYRAMGFEPLISPGLWNWMVPWANFDKAQETMTPFMAIAEDMGVKRILMTMWGDDGQEAPFASNAPGLVSYLDMAYAGAKNNLTRVKALTQTLFHDTLDSFVLPAKMNHNNIGKGFLYDDPLLGPYSLHAGPKRYNRYFLKYRQKTASIVSRCSAANRRLFSFAYAWADFLSVKADLRNTCYALYRQKNKKKLALELINIVTAIKKLNTLRTAHRALWVEERKIQGWEILDMRYGAQMARLETMGERVHAYLKGEIKQLEEFEEKDIPFNGNAVEKVHAAYRNAAIIPYNRWA
jgi:hexosaminidase